MNALLNFPGFVVLVFFHASIWIMLLTGSLRSYNSIRRSYYVLLLDVLHRRSALTLYSPLGTGEARSSDSCIRTSTLRPCISPIIPPVYSRATLQAAMFSVICYALLLLTHYNSIISSQAAFDPRDGTPSWTYNVSACPGTPPSYCAPEIE